MATDTLLRHFMYVVNVTGLVGRCYGCVATIAGVVDIGGYRSKHAYELFVFVMMYLFF